jgi:polyferredoxin
MSTLTAVYCVWLCPFKIITEYEAISGIGSFVATIMFILLFFGLTMVLPHLTQKRMQCSTLCPLGPLQAIIDRITPFGVRIDPYKCSRCLACVKACPTLSLDAELITSGATKPHHSCTKCGECVQVCPRQAVSYNLRPADWIRRKFGLNLTSQSEAAGGSPDGAQVSSALGPGAQTGTRAPRRPLPAPLAWCLALGRELLEPRHLFTVTAFILGCALSYTFAMGTIARLSNLILSGSFIRGY